MKQFKNFIGGKFVNTEAATLPVINPSNGEVYAVLPDSSDETVEKAVREALRSQMSWEKWSIEERSECLIEIANLIDDNLEDLARCESFDTGKPLQLSRNIDIPRAAANFRFFAKAISSFSTEAHLQEGLALNYTRRGALGVVGCISPWNLPLYLLSWKVAPALAMGNTVVAKPSEITPYSAFKLCELIAKSSLPPGVLNIVHGTGSKTGRAIVSHPDVTAISFTGGTNTGREIAQEAAKHFKKVSLELGGKNPTLVFDDVELDVVAKEVVRSAFTNQGEICLCGSRVLIQKTVYDEFSTLLVEEVERWTQGTPDENADLGPVISDDHLRKIDGYVARAKRDGARILTGGYPLERKGYFYAATILDGLDAKCEINQEEVFGPMMSLLPFSNVQEAIDIANGTRYGLAANIWTRDIQRAHQVAHQLKAGIVWVNCWMLRDLRTPFGGMKDSGIGREGGVEALRFFSEAQNVCVKL